MSRKHVFEQLTEVGTRLERFAEALSREKLVESGDALSRWMRAMEGVDLRGLQDDIAFEHTPGLANYLDVQIKDVAKSAQQADEIGFLLSDRYVKDAVERAQQTISRILKKTPSGNRKATPKKPKTKTPRKKRKTPPRKGDTLRESQVRELLANRWSQAQIARELGLTPARVSQLVTAMNKRKEPSGRSIDLSKAHELRPEDGSTAKKTSHRRRPRQE